MATLESGVRELPLISERKVPRQTSPSAERRGIAAALLAFTLLYLAGSLAWTTRKTLWFDELFTYKIAQLRSLRDIWDAIKAGIECNPPLSFVLSHWSQQLFGANAVATRLPAICGYWLMSICLFVFVRRCTDRYHGFVAMLIPFFTIADFYITEA